MNTPPQLYKFWVWEGVDPFLVKGPHTTCAIHCMRWDLPFRTWAIMQYKLWFWHPSSSTFIITRTLFRMMSLGHFKHKIKIPWLVTWIVLRWTIEFTPLACALPIPNSVTDWQVLITPFCPSIVIHLQIFAYMPPHCPVMWSMSLLSKLKLSSMVNIEFKELGY
jgi:hypothetical protein